MYYASESIKLTKKYLTYLELIKNANNRYIDKMHTNGIYDENKERLRYPIKPMNYDFNARYMERMKKLSSWLVLRMQSVITELNEVNIALLRKELSDNEVNSPTA